jgi:S1-C subfamily serine protease
MNCVPASRFPGDCSLTRRLALGIVGTLIAGVVLARADDPPTGPDVVRPTVQLRNGDRRGSGTVIVSVPNQSWILTAAHVVENASDLKVELHRFNFNLGSRMAVLTEGAGWPRLVPATVAAADPAADVALVRIKGMVALPFVARLDPEASEPTAGEVLTSVGIDRGLHLTSWNTTIQGALVIDLHKDGKPRPFTVTSRPPDHGRSGGALFRRDGTVVGVCTGHFENKPGERLGVFAAMSSIRKLLQDQALEKAVRLPAARLISPKPQ